MAEAHRISFNNIANKRDFDAIFSRIRCFSPLGDNSGTRLNAPMITSSFTYGTISILDLFVGKFRFFNTVFCMFFKVIATIFVTTLYFLLSCLRAIGIR